MGRKEHPQKLTYPLMAFRASGEFYGRMYQRAEELGLTPNEVVRRLALLAEAGIDGRHLAALSGVADSMGPRMFEAACLLASQVIDVEAAKHKKPLSEAARQKLILMTIAGFEGRPDQEHNGGKLTAPGTAPLFEARSKAGRRSGRGSKPRRARHKPS